MKAFEVSRVIAAPPERVWSVLTDGNALVTGGLGVSRLEGTIQAGATIRLWSEASPGRAFTLRVRECTAPRGMVWEGGLPLGLFRGVRVFTLSPAPGGCAFHMREEFSGLMAPLITKSMPDLTPTFEKFADGLKRLSEEAR